VKLREKQASFSRQLIENIEADRLRISMDLHDDIGQSLSMIKSKISRFKM
jgi:two-component system NarL family sensor kinase